MRNIIVSACVIALLPTGVFAQGPGERTTTPVQGPLARAISSAGARLQTDLPAERKGHPVRLGALIGLAVGAGAMAVFGLAFCRGFECRAQDYPKAAVFFGSIGAGVGAGVGAIVGAVRRPRPSKSIVVAPVVTRDRRAVLVSIPF
jgi:hypothetical protein